MSKSTTYYGGKPSAEIPLYWFDYSQSIVTATSLENVGSAPQDWTGGALLTDTGTGVSNGSTTLNPTLTVPKEVLNDDFTIFVTFNKFVPKFGLTSSQIFTRIGDTGQIRLMHYVHSFNENHSVLYKTYPPLTSNIIQQMTDNGTNIVTIATVFSNTGSFVNHYDWEGTKYPKVISPNVNTQDEPFELLVTALQSQIQEIRFYNREMDDTEVSTIQSELNAKWK